MEGVFISERHNPPHIARTQRTSAQPKHTASLRQVITNECTLYMATIIDPETVDSMGGPLGWWRHTENLYRLIQFYRPKCLQQSPMATPFLGDLP